MAICFFGSYDRGYARNKILLDGLAELSIPVVHCHSSKGFFVPRYIELIQKFLKVRTKSSVIFVAYRGHLDVLCGFILAKIFGKKLVFDIFYSLHDTYLHDRKSIAVHSFSERMYFLLDTVNCMLSDHVIVLSHATGKFLCNTFTISRKKISVVYGGGNEKVFVPHQKSPNRKKVIVEFHGWFTRMQYPEIFIEAAKLLEKNANIEFWLIGSTVNYLKPLQMLQQEKPKNLVYMKPLSEAKLAKKIALADITVGHLGVTQKAHVTLSHKMYHGLAVGSVLIAGDYEATKEVLIDKKTCILVAPGDSGDLARKIMLLVKNTALREKIAKNGYALHASKFTNRQIALSLVKVIRELGIVL